MDSDQQGFEDLVDSYPLLSELKDESKFLLVMSLYSDKNVLSSVSDFEELFDRLKIKYGFDSVEDLIYHYQAKNTLSEGLGVDRVFQKRG